MFIEPVGAEDSGVLLPVGKCFHLNSCLAAAIEGQKPVFFDSWVWLFWVDASKDSSFCHLSSRVFENGAFWAIWMGRKVLSMKSSMKGSCRLLSSLCLFSGAMYQNSKGELNWTNRNRGSFFSFCLCEFKPHYGYHIDRGSEGVFFLCVVHARWAVKKATWLILPVVICLSQRLSHACLSVNYSYCETANGSLNQL